MPQTYVIGDIHAAHRALLQCLQRANFDYQHDKLICLGDVADGWPDTRAAFDELLKIKNLVYLLGNHDFWTLEWMETGHEDSNWLMQGGQATVDSYSNGIPDSHYELLKEAKLYHIQNNSLFVHAGINPTTHPKEQDLSTLIWDRTFVRMAMHYHHSGEKQKITSFNDVYVGHTPIMEPEPIQYCEVWMMDTGAGWSGKLSMKNIENGESYVSDNVPSLYPGVEGRQRF